MPAHTAQRKESNTAEMVLAGLVAGVGPLSELGGRLWRGSINLRLRAGLESKRLRRRE